MTHAERMNASFRACEGLEDAILEDRNCNIKSELDTLDDQIMLRLVAERRALSLEKILESLVRKTVGFLNAIDLGEPIEGCERLLRIDLEMVRVVLDGTCEASKELSV